MPLFLRITLVFVVLLIIGVVWWGHIDRLLLRLQNPSAAGVAVVRDDGTQAYWLGLFGLHPAHLTEGVVRSQDGAFMARAVLQDETQPQELASWEIELVDASGNGISLGHGHAPQFFMREETQYLFFLTPEGVAVTEPFSGATTVLRMPVLHDVRSPGAIDPEGRSFVLQDPTSFQYVVYELVSLDPFVIEPQVVIEEGVGSVVYGTDSLFGTRERDGRTALVRFDGEEGTEVYVFQDGERYRLLPH